MRRVAILALRFAIASKARFILLTLMVAIAMTIFLVVSELSRLSALDLNRSIAQEAGETGTYAIDTSVTFGLAPPELASRVRRAISPYLSGPLMVVEILARRELGCPPSSGLGSQPILIVRDGAGTLQTLTGERVPSDTMVCLDGQVIPRAAIRIPSPAQRLAWLGIASGSPETGVILDGAYERAALLGSTDGPTYRFLIVTGNEVDRSVALQSALERSFASTSRSFGISSPGSIFGVTRLDTAQAIRRAAVGVDLVYSVIGWGILILGGLGLLVAEMIVVRDRSWFFGLARAVGGRGAHIATLVVIDVAILLIIGTALAVMLALMLQPLASSFASSAFQIQDVRVLQPSRIPELIAGAFLVLLVAAFYPALRAVRQDPLDVLEPRVS